MPSQGNEKLAEIGPFGGLDFSGDLLYIKPNNAVDGGNFDVTRRFGTLLPQLGRTGGVQTHASKAQSIALWASQVVAAYADGTIQVAGTSYTGPYNTTAFTYSEVCFTVYPLPSSFGFGSGLFFSYFIGGDTAEQQSFKIVNSTATNWQIGTWTFGIAPTLAASGVSSMSGLYYYCVTYVNNSTGQESSHGPYSSGITVFGTGVNVTIKHSTDPQATNINIYRLGGTIQTWSLIATVTNTDQTYTDTTADSAVVGQSLVLHRDSPPGFQATCYHKGRMWGLADSQRVTTFTAANSYSLQQVSGPSLWFSRLGEPWSFDNTNAVLPILETNGASSAEGGSCALYSLGSVLYAWTVFGFYACFGDSESDFRVVKQANIGCAGPKLLAGDETYVAWVSPAGVVWLFDGNTPVDISTGADGEGGIKIPLDNEVFSGNGFGGFVKNANPKWAIAIFRRAIYLSDGSVTYVYHIPSKRWGKFSYGATAFATQSQGGLFQPGQLGLNGPWGPSMIAAGPTTGVDQWMNRVNDTYGNPVTTWKSPELDAGMPQARKTWRFAVVEIPPGDIVNIIVLQLYIDGVLQYTSPNLHPRTNFPTPGLAYTRLSLNALCKGFRVQIALTLTTASSTSAACVQRVTLWGSKDDELISYGIGGT